MPSTRYAARNARLYVDVSAGGTGNATPAVFIKSFTMDNTTDKPEVTAWGDTNKTYLAGLPDDKGSYSGYDDIAGNTLYTVARDGIPRKFYLYPDFANAPGTYFFGKALFDHSLSLDVAQAGQVSGSWVATSDIVRVVA